MTDIGHLPASLKGVTATVVAFLFTSEIKLYLEPGIEKHISEYPILIIDDEKDICFMLSSILKQRSFKTASVHTITDAGHWLQVQKPLIVFLDNNLPDGRGVDFIPILKKIVPEAKVIMITAYDTPSDRRSALANGADEFIGKPFTRQMIYATVEKLLN